MPRLSASKTYDFWLQTILHHMSPHSAIATNDLIHRTNNPMNQIICSNCGMRGHMMKDCLKPKIICFGCGQPGHMKLDCPNRQNQQVGRGNGGGDNQGGGGFK